MFGDLIGPALLIAVVVAVVLLCDAWLWQRQCRRAMRDLERARRHEAHATA
jgi:hypothetical protein